MNQHNKNNHTYAILGLVVGCLIFGLGSLIVIFVSLNAYALTFWRLFIALLIFLLVYLIGKRSSSVFLKQENHFPRNKKAISFALLAGIFLAFDLSLWHESIHGVGPGISTLLNSLQIFFVAGIGYIFFNEKPSYWQILSLIIAVIGVACIASPELKLNNKAIWGLVSGLLSGFMLAASMACIRKTHDIEKTGIIPLMMMLSFSGCVVTVPIMIWLNAPILPTSMQEVTLIIIYGAVMQCFAWGLIAFNIPKLSLAVTGLVLLTEPVFAVVIDYFYLNKPINGLQWFGICLTLIAIYTGTIQIGAKDKE